MVEKGIYKVGGCVRDKILGKRVKDIDYLVIGYTEDEFLAKFPKAKKKGLSFPVFDIDGNDYAFPRKEFKVAPGHTGFEIVSNESVSIFDDLNRRDLTINAMAEDENGRIIATKQSIDDIQNRVLRHVSDHFVEDPLRVYRVARFAAKFPDFSIAKETIELMKNMKSMLTELSIDRVSNEFLVALKYEEFYRFFDVLNECKLLDVHFNSIKNMFVVSAGSKKRHPEGSLFNHIKKCCDKVKNENECVKFATFAHDLGKLHSANIFHHNHDIAGINVIKQLSKEIKLPAKLIKAGIFATQYHSVFHNLKNLRPVKAAELVIKIDKNFPGGFSDFQKVMQADGGNPKYLDFVHSMLKKLYEVKLPEKHKNRGALSAEILATMRGEVWKENLK